MIKPKALKTGDLIGFVAPSGVMRREDVYEAQKSIEEWGFRVALGKSCFQRHGYLSGTDQVRAEDINSMFENNEIKCIMCLRGGYGATRILKDIDFAAIKKNPKLFIGFSDITALHIVLTQRCGLITLHGPMASGISSNMNNISKRALWNAMTVPSPLGKINNPPESPVVCLVKGEGRGRIAGGNLTMLVSTLGTPYEIDTKGKLLLLEEIGEEPYRIDRMLTQLLQAGKLQDVSGFILGDFNNCNAVTGKPSLGLEDIFKELIIPLKKPTVGNFKIGHCSPNITVPMGVNAFINAEEGLLYVEESATI